MDLEPNLPIDAMGPKGRGCHELAKRAGQTYAEMAVTPPVAAYIGFIHGLEIGLALQATEPDWAREALEQLLAHGYRRHGGDDPAHARQNLLRDVGALKAAALQYGDS